MSTQQPLYVPPKVTQLTPQQRSILETKQLATFLGMGALTVVTAVVGKRSVLNRRFIPQLFDSNNRPPTFNLVKDAATAVFIATTLAVSSFGFATSGVAWLTGASSIRDFSIVMKNAWGGAEKEREQMNRPLTEEDKETEKVLRELDDALAGLGGNKKN